VEHQPGDDQPAFAYAVGGGNEGPITGDLPDPDPTDQHSRAV
jgi:hypothetical protein